MSFQNTWNSGNMRESRDPNVCEIPVEVTTVNMETMGVDSVKVVDHGDLSDRKWLIGHCHAAMRNNMGIQLRPMSVL